jgi:hypothetical protein
MSKITLLAQMIQLLPAEKFKKLANELECNKHSKGIDSWTHLVTMLFCHLSNAASCRDISNGLLSIAGNINPLGCKQAPSKSSVSYINKHRDHRLFEKFFYEVIDHLGQHVGFQKRNLKRLTRQVFLMDATVIPLCAKVFDWAKFRQYKGAVKIHMVLDYQGCIPHFASITDGKVHESKMAKLVHFPAGSVVVFDRGYVDYKWLHDLDSRNIYFVTRAKDNMNYEVTTAYETDSKSGFVYDDNIKLIGQKSSSNYPHTLRRVEYIDPATGQELVFLTSHKQWTAATVAELYKERWNIEVFFKHIKTHLRIKSFVGTSENAVKIQIWTSLIAIVLLKALQQMGKYKWHLSNLINALRLHLFAKIELNQFINKPFEKSSHWEPENIQLSLFT